MLPTMSPEIRAWLARRRSSEIRDDVAEVTRSNHHGAGALRRDERGRVRRLARWLEGTPARSRLRRKANH